MRGFRIIHHTEKVGDRRKERTVLSGRPASRGALTWVCRRTEYRRSFGWGVAGRVVSAGMPLRHRVRRRRASVLTNEY